LSEFAYCDPIPCNGDRPCTVEFAETRGGFLYSWRITSEDDHPKGKTRVGTCEWSARATFYYDHEATRYTDEDDFVEADREDRAAIVAAWPTWESILKARHAEEDDAGG
jgi:hypothetical protein